MSNSDDSSCQARALAVLRQLGYTGLSPAALLAERDSRREVLLVDRLVAALHRLNPGLSAAHVHLALRELTGTRAPDLITANQRVHRLLTRGLELDSSGTRRPRTVRYLDLNEPAANDLVVTWQLPVRGVQRQVVLDLVVFVNGIPLVVIQCEDAATAAPADPSWLRATLAELWRWQEPEKSTHELGVPRLFETTQLILALGAQTAVYGAVLTPPQHFARWPTAWPHTPEEVAAQLGRSPTAQDLLLYGLLTPPTFFELLQNFVAFHQEGTSGHTDRTLSRASEFVAVQRATAHAHGGAWDATQRGPGGVVWHAAAGRGGRQHLMMAWLAGKLRPALRQHARALVLVAESPGAARYLIQTLQDVGLGIPEEVDNLESLQRLLSAPESHIVLITAANLRSALGGVAPKCQESPLPLDGTAPSPSLSRERERGRSALWQQPVGEDDLGILAATSPAVLIAEVLGSPAVLIAEVLGSPAAGLVTLLRQALPTACLFGFTSTPLATHDLATRSALGPYVATYGFADAIADDAAVPVYFAARQPAPAGTPAERALALCRDVREHFLRVIRPGGGRAQLLVGSAAAVRLYRQALDRLGDRGPEILVRCEPLASRDSDAGMQAVYLATPLPGRALLQAVLSVNTPIPDKLFGLVIDYVGTDGDLPAALDEFAAADIADALRRPADELLRLPELAAGDLADEMLRPPAAPGEFAATDLTDELLRLPAAPGEFAATDLADELLRLPAALGEFAAADVADALRRPADELPKLPQWHHAALTPLAGAKNLYSLEQCIATLGDPTRRREFQHAFRHCARALELFLDTPQAQGFVAELRWLGQVLLAAAARYRDTPRELVDCGPRVRQLIADAVERDGTAPLLTCPALLSQALDDKLAALPTPAARVSELLHALKHEVQLRHDDDPAFFTPLRAQLADLFGQAQSGQVPPELVLPQLRGLRASLSSRLGSAVPLGLSARAAVVYAVLTGAAARAAAEAQLPYGIPLDPISRALAVQLDELITAQLSATTVHPVPARQDALRNAILRHLLTADFTAERAAVLAARLVERLALREDG